MTYHEDFKNDNFLNTLKTYDADLFSLSLLEVERFII